MNNIKKIILSFFTIMVILFSPLYAEIIYETGNIINEIKEQKELTYKKHTGQYKEFSPGSINDAKILSTFFNIGIQVKTLPFMQESTAKLKIHHIAAELDKLNYDFVIFKNTLTDQTFYELREKINRKKHGWGTYIFNPEYVYNVLVECPHPRYDKSSWEIGINVFIESDSKGFLMAGAHRFTNKKKKGNLYGNSDVAHIKRSIFQIMHIAWCDCQTSTYQIHGFSSKKYKNVFSERTDVVISSGKGIITKEIFILNKLFRKLSKERKTPIHCHAAHENQQYSLLNIAVNRNDLLNPNTEERVSNIEALNRLAASDNRQGKYSIYFTMSPFVHIELSSTLRFLNKIHPILGSITIDAITKTIKTTAVRRQFFAPKFSFNKNLIQN